MLSDCEKIARWRYAKKKGYIDDYLVYEIYTDGEWVVDKAYLIKDNRIECAAVAHYDRLIELGYTVRFTGLSDEF